MRTNRALRTTHVYLLSCMRLHGARAVSRREPFLPHLQWNNSSTYSCTAAGRDEMRLGPGQITCLFSAAAYRLSLLHPNDGTTSLTPLPNHAQVTRLVASGSPYSHGTVLS